MLHRMVVRSCALHTSHFGESALVGIEVHDLEYDRVFSAVVHCEYSVHKLKVVVPSWTWQSLRSCHVRNPHLIDLR